MSERLAAPYPDACKDCPSRFLKDGEFDIDENVTTFRNGPAGYRISSNGTPTCIHPEKAGLQPGKLSKDIDDTMRTEKGRFPSSFEDLVGLIEKCIESAAPESLQVSLDEIEEAALHHGFTNEQVVDGVRLAMSHSR